MRKPRLLKNLVLMSLFSSALVGCTSSNKGDAAAGTSEASATGGSAVDAAGGGADGAGGTAGTTGHDGSGSGEASATDGTTYDGTGTDDSAATFDGAATDGAPGRDAGGSVDSTSNADVPQAEGYVVAMVQASKDRAEDLSQSEVAALVADAVSKAGGLDFIKDGQTVVLKPNLVTAYTDMKRTPASPTVNGVATDWRVVKAVADLVRAKNPNGKILVMEGSTNPTAQVYSLLGYTTESFGASVDELIAVEGASCTDRSTGALVQKAAISGTLYWANTRYVTADVVISIPTMKTHVVAGITGAVKNLAIGMTPVGQFAAAEGRFASDCTRGQTAAYIDHSSPETLGQFIRDYYSIRPADFVVMDGLQGLEHGPLPMWDNSGTYDYESSKKNMRLILAGTNAVAVDTIQALVMTCDPKKVPHLTKLEADGFGTTDTARITVVGKQVAEVAKPFAGKQTDICPGT